METKRDSPSIDSILPVLKSLDATSRGEPAEESSEESEEVEWDPPKSHAVAKCYYARYMFTAMAAISFAIIYGLKANLSVAIVAMVNYTAIELQEGVKPHSDECPAPNTTKAVAGPFVWTEDIQAYILAAYFYGYLVSQIPGAYLAEYWSSKWTMLIAVALNIVCCAVTPWVCHGSHYGVFIFIRIMQGIGGGLTFPTMHYMISHWAPPGERSAIAAIIYAGTALGTVGSTLLAGYVAFYLGWEWVFFLMALASIPWCFFWVWLASDTPYASTWIREEEREMIMESVGDTPKKKKVPRFPTKQVFTSLPFWAILVAHFCGNCGWYMILTQLPSFMKYVLHKNLKENAGMSALPYFLMWLLSVLLGVTLDQLMKRKTIKTGTARKIATGIASVIPAGCMIGISFIKCDALAGTIIIIVAVTSIGAMFCGYLANHIDIAPHFAALLMGITNTIATVPGIFMPILVGELVEGHQTLARWSIAFYTVAALNIFMFIFYTIFASGEIQEWNNLA